MSADLIPTGAGIAGAIGAGGYALAQVGRFMRETFPLATAELDKALGAEIVKRASDREQRFSRTVADVAAERSLTAPTREAPVGVLYPLLEAALLEDDDDLRKHWAQMFINAVDANSTAETRRAYVSLFQDCGRLDIKILAVLHETNLKHPGVRVWTKYLPDRILLDTDEYVKEIQSGRERNILPDSRTMRSLWNLVRLGLIDSASLGEGDRKLMSVMMTSLGVGLVEACTAPRV